MIRIEASLAEAQGQRRLSNARVAQEDDLGLDSAPLCRSIDVETQLPGLRLLGPSAAHDGCAGTPKKVSSEPRVVMGCTTRSTQHYFWGANT